MHTQSCSSADSLGALMERYAAGEDGVFDQLYRSLAPRLYRFCQRLAVRKPEADDCFQETFLRLHRARATYLRGSDVLHWSFAIARSVYLTRLRYWRRRPEHLGTAQDVAEGSCAQTSDPASPEAQLMARHLLHVVSSELQRMSANNRIAYTLLKEENLSAKDAAAILGTSADVVRQRAHRAYEQLKTALSGAGWREYGDDRVET